LRAIKALDDLLDLRMDQRLASGDAHHRGAAFVDGLEALLGGQALVQGFFGELDLAATGAFQVAAEEGLEHQDERVPFVPLQLLRHHVTDDAQRLGNGDRHIGGEDYPHRSKRGKFIFFQITAFQAWKRCVGGV
jgi:hypothetical protein